MKRIASFAIAVITLLSAVSCSSASEKSNSTSNKAANVITDKSRIFKRSELPFPDKLNTITDILYEEKSGKVCIIGQDESGETLCCFTDSSFSMYRYADLGIRSENECSAAYLLSDGKLYALLTQTNYADDDIANAEYTYKLNIYDDSFSLLSFVNIENTDEYDLGQASGLYMAKDSGLVAEIGSQYVTIAPDGRITSAVQREKNDELGITELIDDTEKYSYYYNDNTAFYGVKSDKSREKLVDFANSGLNQVRSIAPLADDEFVCTIGGKLYRLSERDNAELADVKEITLAVALNIDSIQPMIADFNSGSNLYRVNVKNYSDGHEHTIEGFESAAHDLEMDIISGNAPDMVWLDTNETEKLASKGAFTNLYELMESDTRFTRDAFLPNYLEAAETNGHLYSITPTFMIRTMAAKSKFVDKENWTFDEFKAVYESRPDGMELFETANNRNAVFDRLSNSGADFIDLTTHTCSFDSQEFIDMLEFAGQFPGVDEYAWEQCSCRNDTALLSDMYFSSFRDINVQKQSVFGEDMTFVGAPSADGKGSVMLPSNQFAIMATSDNKEGAWEFIKLFLADECYNGNPNGIPVTENGLKKVMEAALEPPFYYDELNGNKKVYMDETGMDSYSNEQIKITSMTDDEQKRYEQFVRSVRRISSGNTELAISSIISEETEYYFAGEHSAKQCAEMIQNRVSILLSEQQ
ncbi:MAG: extracellular solute-binding protein [Ruminococcus sp.]|nr:extracellular solute-binding protein [Ruminococcus sp.]